MTGVVTGRDSAFILSEKAISLDPSLPEGYILLSAIYQYQLGKQEEAYVLLDSAANFGWFGLWYVARDSLLNGIRQEERFQAMVSTLSAENEAVRNAFKEVMNDSDAREQLSWFFDSK